MALSDLKVFSEFVYTTKTEVLAQEIDLFNAASRNCIVLGSANVVGDFSSELYFAKVSGGLVRRRNAFGNGDIPTKNLSMLEDVMVKIASGTPQVEMNPSQWEWLQINQAEAGAAMGQQLAVDTMAEMVNTAVGAAAAAIQNNSAVLTDISGNSDPASPLVSPVNLNTASGKFGDMQTRIGVWIMHSKVITDYYNNALQNAERLYSYGTVNVLSDAFGRVFIISDVPALVIPGSPNKYITLGLGPGGIVVNQQNDFNDNWSELNGKENITRSYQAEWSYMLGLKGYAWDKANGGASPTDASIMTGSNWDQIATSVKDTAGIGLLSE